MKKVLIIEDQTILSDLLARLIEDNPFFELSGRWDNGQDGLRAFEREEPDIVVLDIGLPKLNGVEVLERIKKANPSTYVLVFTGRVDSPVIQMIMQKGADGFLEKKASLEELEKALDHAQSGQPYYTIMAMRAVKEAFNQPSRETLLDSLSPREREVLQLIAEGHTTKEICRTVNLSMGTVNTHRWNLMRKLNIHDAASLTRFAIEQGLTELESSGVED